MPPYYQLLYQLITHNDSKNTQSGLGLLHGLLIGGVGFLDERDAVALQQYPPYMINKNAVKCKILNMIGPFEPLFQVYRRENKKCGNVEALLTYRLPSICLGIHLHSTV